MSAATICPKCRVVYIEGESHRCEPKPRWAALWFWFIFVYVVLVIAMDRKPVMPFAAAGWLIKFVLVKLGVMS
jgi:hypothetical protein